eukprot:5944407-Amphidinium_carterae.1
MLGEAALQEEVKEAYEACGKKGRPPPATGGLPSDEEICKAAWQLENGIYNQFLSKFPENIIDARDLHFKVLKATGYYNIAIIALIILTAVEVPPWCHGIHSIDLWKWQAGDESCFVKKGDLNLSGVPYLPPGYALLFEVAIEAVIMWKFMLEYQLETVHFQPLGVHYFSMLNIRLGFIFAVVRVNAFERSQCTTILDAEGSVSPSLSSCTIASKLCWVSTTCPLQTVVLFSCAQSHAKIETLMQRGGMQCKARFLENWFRVVHDLPVELF